jgi:hypothetical protein
MTWRMEHSRENYLKIIHDELHKLHSSLILLGRINCKSSHHQIACFKVTAKSHNFATQTAEPRRVKTTHNSQGHKASNAVLLTKAARKGGGCVLSFCGCEACNLVTVTIG